MKYIIECVMTYKLKFNNALHELTFAEGFNIQHYPPEWGFPKWHNERSMQLTHQRALVFMTYLNDVEDGVVQISNIKIQDFKQKKVQRLFGRQTLHIHTEVKYLQQKKNILLQGG